MEYMEHEAEGAIYKTAEDIEREAKAKLDEAEHKKKEAEAKAKAEKEANELKKQTLTDNIIKEKFIEKWNGELPKATNGSSIFNIDSLLK